MEYRSVIGKLQYLSLTRPDIAFTVNKLSQFMNRPMTEHWTIVKQLLRYLVGTIDHGLFLQRNSPLSLHAYSDSDWENNPDDRSSTSVCVVFLGTNPISWSSKKQKFIACSSAKAEYIDVAFTTAEFI